MGSPAIVFLGRFLFIVTAILVDIG